ncbi:hypothetical protein ACA910_015403 [Epithemia clementina (nom. ined.)]
MNASNHHGGSENQGPATVSSLMVNAVVASIVIDKTRLMFHAPSSIAATKPTTTAGSFRSQTAKPTTTLLPSASTTLNSPLSALSARKNPEKLQPETQEKKPETKSVLALTLTTTATTATTASSSLTTKTVASSLSSSSLSSQSSCVPSSPLSPQENQIKKMSTATKSREGSSDDDRCCQRLAQNQHPESGAVWDLEDPEPSAKATSTDNEEDRGNPSTSECVSSPLIYHCCPTKPPHERRQDDVCVVAEDDCAAAVEENANHKDNFFHDDDNNDEESISSVTTVESYSSLSPLPQSSSSPCLPASRSPKIMVDRVSFSPQGGTRGAQTIKTTTTTTTTEEKEPKTKNKNDGNSSCLALSTAPSRTVHRPTNQTPQSPPQDKIKQQGHLKLRKGVPLTPVLLGRLRRQTKETPTILHRSARGTSNTLNRSQSKERVPKRVTFADNEDNKTLLGLESRRTFVDNYDNDNQDALVNPVSWNDYYYSRQELSQMVQRAQRLVDWVLLTNKNHPKSPQPRSRQNETPSTTTPAVTSANKVVQSLQICYIGFEGSTSNNKQYNKAQRKEKQEKALRYYYYYQIKEIDGDDDIPPQVVDTATGVDKTTTVTKPMTTTLRGLERQLLTPYMVNLRQDCIQSVLALQDKLRAGAGASGTAARRGGRTSTLSLCMEEALQKQSAAMSHKARRFARFLGKGDAAIVLKTASMLSLPKSPTRLLTPDQSSAAGVEPCASSAPRSPRSSATSKKNATIVSTTTSAAAGTKKSEVACAASPRIGSSYRKISSFVVPSSPRQSPSSSALPFWSPSPGHGKKGSIGGSILKTIITTRSRDHRSGKSKEANKSLRRSESCHSLDDSTSITSASNGSCGRANTISPAKDQTTTGSVAKTSNLGVLLARLPRLDDDGGIDKQDDFYCDEAESDDNNSKNNNEKTDGTPIRRPRRTDCTI